MLIKARPFNFPYEGALDTVRCAIVAIDMQVDFLSIDGYFARKGYDPAPLRAVIPTIKSVTNAGRKAGMRIIWTRQGYRSDLGDVAPYDRWRNARAGIPLKAGDGASLLRGSAGYQIVPELTPPDGDIIVDKTANGAFYQTDLELILKAQDITHLIFTGCTTDVCVHTTLREANDRKYQCLLIEDACASSDAYAHAAAVHMVTVEDGIFGVVADSGALLDAIDRERAAAA